MLRWQFVLVGVVALTLSACKKNEQPAAMPAETFSTPAATDTKSTDSDLYARDPLADDPYATDPYATGGAPSARTKSTTAPEEVVVAGDIGKTHVVKKGDTLYSLARQYYGNQSKWKTIYDANRAKINNPDKLQVGQTLVIP